MSGTFYIVGPTATGKSEIAAEVAIACQGEIISADAYQIYAGLDLLTAKPERDLMQRVPHHLIGSVPLAAEMNAECFRRAALETIAAIYARGRNAFIVGGSGMYLQALTAGLSDLPSASPPLRAWLAEFSERELLVRLAQLDPVTAGTIDRRNKHRLIRAVEICLLSGRPVSEQRQRSAPGPTARGVLLLRERGELYGRIDARVEAMFAQGVIDEVRRVGEVGLTAAKTLGLGLIRQLIAGEISQAECIASIQQATRRYAKRQLTWFRRQSNFEPLNLSHHGSSEALAWIARKARLSFAQRDD